MTVILATDGKPHSENASEYAFRYAVNFDEPLYIVSVITSRMETDKEYLLNAIESDFDDLRKKGSEAGVEVHTLLEYGDPAAKVMALSEEFKASAIIVGTSRKTALDRVILGSVSDGIVRNSRTTVIVVR